MSTTPCAVAIGSNRQASVHIPLALDQLAKKFSHLQFSSSYQSHACGYEDGHEKAPDYINLIALFETHLKLHPLIHTLKAIEYEIDPISERTQANIRKIDLDLLLYGDQCSNKHNIPHSDISQFAYVACPLAELMPMGKHPINGYTYRQLCEKVRDCPQLTQISSL